MVPFKTFSPLIFTAAFLFITGCGNNQHVTAKDQPSDLAASGKSSEGKDSVTSNKEPAAPSKEPSAFSKEPASTTEVTAEAAAAKATKLCPEGTNISTCNGITPAAAPTASAITPNTGSVDGGTLLEITGSGFTPNNNTVLIDGMPCEKIEVNNVGSSIKCTTPKHEKAGAADVVITNGSGGRTTFPNGFTYKTQPAPTVAQNQPAPIIARITVVPALSTPEAATPGSTPIAPSTGSVITIEGLGLDKPGTVIIIDGTQCETIKRIDDNTFLCRTTTPVESDENVSTRTITIQIPGGVERTFIIEHTVAIEPPIPPTVTKITPKQGLAAGGDLITLEGSNLDQVDAVSFDTVLCTGFKLINPSKIECTTPPHNTFGAVDVSLQKNGVVQSAYVGSFWYLEPAVPAAPTVTKITPNQGATAGGDLITLEGSNLDQVDAVYFDTVLCTGFKLISPNKIECTTPPHNTPGAVDVSFQKNGSAQTVQVGAFWYLGPAVSCAVCPTCNPAPSAASCANYVTVVNQDSCKEPITKRFYATALLDSEFKALESDATGLLPYVKEVPAEKSDEYKANCKTKKVKGKKVCRTEPTLSFVNLGEKPNYKKKFMKDTGTVFKVLLDLPVNESEIYIDSFHADLRLAVLKKASEREDKYDDTESVGFVQLKKWSGKLFHDSTFKFLINPKFKSDENYVNTFYSEELLNGIRRTKRKVYQKEMLLHLETLLAKEKKTLTSPMLLDMIYSLPRDAGGKVTAVLAVYDDTRVLSEYKYDGGTLNTFIEVSYDRKTHNPGCDPTPVPAATPPSTAPAPKAGP